MSSTSGVVRGLGPSSNVSTSSGPPDAESPAAGVGQPLAPAAVLPSTSIATTNPMRFTLPV